MFNDYGSKIDLIAKFFVKLVFDSSGSSPLGRMIGP